MKKSKKQRYFDKKKSNVYDQNKKKIILYKTEFCRSFEETGYCRYKEKCQFAHSIEELRPVDRHPKYRTEMCKTFWEKGTCPYGKRCCFIHTFKDDIKGDSLISTSNLMESKIKQLNTPTTTSSISNLSFDTNPFLLNNNTATATKASANLNNSIISRTLTNSNTTNNKDSKMNINAKAFEPSKKINTNNNNSNSNTVNPTSTHTPQPKSYDNFSDNSTTSTLFSYSSSFPANSNNGNSNGSEVQSSTASFSTLNEGGSSGGPFSYTNPNLLNMEVYHSYLMNSSNSNSSTSNFGSHSTGHGGSIHHSHSPLETLTHGCCASPTGSVCNSYISSFSDYRHPSTSTNGNGMERMNEHRTEHAPGKLTEDVFGLDGMLNLDHHSTSTSSGVTSTSHDMFCFGNPLLPSSNKSQVGSATSAAAVAAMYCNGSATMTNATATANPSSNNTVIGVRPTPPTLTLNNAGDPRLTGNEAIGSLYPTLPTLLHSKLGSTFSPSSIPNTPNSLMNSPSSLSLPHSSAIHHSYLNLTNDGSLSTNANKISNLSYLSSHRPTTNPEGQPSEVMLNAMKNSNSLDEFAFPILQSSHGQCPSSSSVNHRPIPYQQHQQQQQQLQQQQQQHHQLNKNHSLGVLNDGSIVTTTILDPSTELTSSPPIYSCYRSDSSIDHPTTNANANMNVNANVSANTNPSVNVNASNGNANVNGHLNTLQALDLEPSPVALPIISAPTTLPLRGESEDYLLYKTNDIDTEKAKLYSAFTNPKFIQVSEYFKSIQKPHSREILGSNAVTTAAATSTNPSCYGMNTITNTIMNGSVLQQQQQTTLPKTNSCSQMNNIITNFSALSINNSER